MRRIPRPQRAIDPSLPISPLLRHQIPPPSCLRPVSPYPRLRTTSASFSTTPTFSFLLNGKQDKKKHQQFVRRWQKRLLGDSEPIGAHVDPYDPTSPVRIAPEEQGEELEVLEDDQRADLVPEVEALYEEEYDGTRLRHVGGQKWVEQLEEGNLAKEFEKLTMRTYTPLSLNMANQIEELTGTPYTLRDENLMMAQTFHDFTGKPYTQWSFGRWTRARNLDSVRENFHRAVVEIYALKQAGKELDPSACANRGVYDAPEWLQDIKLQQASNGEFILAFPEPHKLETLLGDMQRVPEWSPEQELPAEEELLAEEGEEIPMLQPEQPTMDPDTPLTRRAALVKQDPDKKPFDFMSNRPVPRANPVEPVAETAEKTQQEMSAKPQATQKTVSASPTADLEAATEVSQPTIAELRHAVLESAARSAEQNIAALKQAVRASVSSHSSKPTAQVPAPETEARWRHVPLTDPAIKFALTKRLNQLTGLYISDPHLTSVATLGDLYHYFCAAAKPKLAKINDYINVEGGRQNHKANLSAQQQDALSAAPKQKLHVGTLLKLRNVEIHRQRPNAKEERRKIGLNKAVFKELQRLDLLDGPSKRVRPPRAIEGTRIAPEFGTTIPLSAVQVLKKRTQRKRRQWTEEQGLDSETVDRIVRKSNTPEARTV